MPVRGSHPPYTGLQPSRFTSSGHGQFHHEERLIDGIGFTDAEWLRQLDERFADCIRTRSATFTGSNADSYNTINISFLRRAMISHRRGKSPICFRLHHGGI